MITISSVNLLAKVLLIQANRNNVRRFIQLLIFRRLFPYKTKVFKAANVAPIKISDNVLSRNPEVELLCQCTRNLEKAIFMGGNYSKSGRFVVSYCCKRFANVCFGVLFF